MPGVTVDTNTSQLVRLGGRWQHSLNIVDTRLDTSGQFRQVRENGITVILDVICRKLLTVFGFEKDVFLKFKQC